MPQTQQTIARLDSSISDSTGAGSAGIAINPPAMPVQREGTAPEVLWLFGLDWAALAAKRFSGTYKVHSAGFDLFSFPSNAGVLWFDMERFVRRLARKHRNRLSAVLSHEEQFGALAAALVAEALDLPGTPVNAILKLQHKLICRDIIQKVAPECNLGYRTLDCALGELPTRCEIEYPVFCKPVKASFSVLARRLDSHEDLMKHVRFKPFEKHIIERLVKPFDDICKARLSSSVDARSLLLEENYNAAQFNLDGYVYDGQPRLLGVVDEVMYPDTQAFLRFAYPSKLKPAVRQRAFDVASAVLKEAGFDHGFFNMEFFYNESTDELKIVEFNPRLAAQLADLYERVDGIDVHAMSLALAMGQDPARVARRKPKGSFAASCALRTFDGTMPPAVPRAIKRGAEGRFSDAIILYFHKSRSGTEREFKWMSSNRYGVINLHGDGEDGLRHRYEQICQSLGWPAPF